MQHYLGGKGKDRVAPIKSLIYMSFWKWRFEGHAKELVSQSRFKM